MTVEYADGRTSPVRVLPVSQVAFERHFKTSFPEAFGGRPSFEHLFWVAWHAARTGVEFDQWLESVAGVSFGADEPVDPTNPVPSDGA